MTFLGYSGIAHEGAGCGTVSDMFGRITLVSSTIDFLFELEPRPTLRGVRVQCFQTAKGYSNASSVRGKKRAIGWILQLLRGCTASAPHGEHETPCGPILGMQQHAHRVSVFTYVQAYVH